MLAWQTARMYFDVRNKQQLKAPKDYMLRRGPQRQTYEQQYHALEMLSKQIGTPLRRKGAPTPMTRTKEPARGQ